MIADELGARVAVLAGDPGDAAVAGPLSSESSDEELHAHLLGAGRRTPGWRARRQRGEEHG